MRDHIAVFLVILTLAGTTLVRPASAVDEEIAISWGELGPFFAGGKIVGTARAMIVLPDGAVVQGRIVTVEQDKLVLDVTSSSDKRAYPKGRTSIPRSSVSTIRVTQMKEATGRIAGTVAGIVGGAAVGAFLALENENPSAAARAGVLALWVGTGVGGYYVGRRFDREAITVRIVK